MKPVRLFILLIALSPVSVVAEPLPGTKFGVIKGASLPVKTHAAPNPCASYGAGFVQVEGTSSCVKVGGSVSVDVGGAGRLH